MNAFVVFRGFYRDHFSHDFRAQGVILKGFYDGISTFSKVKKSIQINQTIKVKSWKKRKNILTVGFHEISLWKSTRDSSTSFWSPDRVTISHSTWRSWTIHAWSVESSRMNWLVSYFTVRLILVTWSGPNVIIGLIFPLEKKGQFGKKLLFNVLQVYGFPFTKTYPNQTVLNTWGKFNTTSHQLLCSSIWLP